MVKNYTDQLPNLAIIDVIRLLDLFAIHPKIVFVVKALAGSFDVVLEQRRQRQGARIDSVIKPSYVF